MKRTLFALLVLVLFTTACGQKATSAPSVTLTVSMGDVVKTYSLEDLQMLGNSEASFESVNYIGIPLAILLEDAGFDPASLSAVKAVASDGFTANYDPAIFNLPDTLIAYARADGPLSKTEAPFTMVIPNQPGRMNVRMVVEIIAVP